MLFKKKTFALWCIWFLAKVNFDVNDLTRYSEDSVENNHFFRLYTPHLNVLKINEKTLTKKLNTPAYCRARSSFRKKYNIIRKNFAQF